MNSQMDVGSVVKTPDGVGRIYKIYNDNTVVVTVKINDTLVPQLYNISSIESLHCELFNKQCDYTKSLLLAYPECCEYCRFQATLDADDIDA